MDSELQSALEHNLIIESNFALLYMAAKGNINNSTKLYLQNCSKQMQKIQLCSKQKLLIMLKTSLCYSTEQNMFFNHINNSTDVDIISQFILFKPTVYSLVHSEIN